MKIAIPTRGKEVDDHFGHCEFYTIFDIDDDRKIIDRENYAAPAGCGCKSNIASILKGKGVDTMLAGNMGQGAVSKIALVGIQVIRGCSGDVDVVVDAYLNKKLVDSGLTCADHGHHGGDHQCQN